MVQNYLDIVCLLNLILLKIYSYAGQRLTVPLVRYTYIQCFQTTCNSFGDVLMRISIMQRKPRFSVYFLNENFHGRLEGIHLRVSVLYLTIFLEVIEVKYYCNF